MNLLIVDLLVERYNDFDFLLNLDEQQGKVVSKIQKKKEKKKEKKRKSIWFQKRKFLKKKKDQRKSTFNRWSWAIIILSR